MTAILRYPADGRGAWPSNGKGGTLKADGVTPGPYYRSPATTKVPTIGLVGYRADQGDDECSIDDYAVWRAALAIQTRLRDLGYVGADGNLIAADGLWGKNTDHAVRAFQTDRGLPNDGIFGRMSARAMWEPEVKRVAAEVDTDHAADLARIMVGTINTESTWDCGAVGGDPQDLGLGQINGLAHPTMSANDRLNPKMALPFIARFIDGNLVYFKYNVRDAVCAYNLGRGGTNSWIKAGRPDWWTPTGSTSARNMKAYIDKILSA